VGEAQRLGALVIEHRLLELGFCVLQVGLGLLLFIAAVFRQHLPAMLGSARAGAAAVEIGLVLRLLDFREQLILLDRLPFAKRELLDLAAHLRADQDRRDRDDEALVLDGDLVARRSGFGGAARVRLLILFFLRRGGGFL